MRTILAALAMAGGSAAQEAGTCGVRELCGGGGGGSAAARGSGSPLLPPVIVIRVASTVIFFLQRDIPRDMKASHKTEIILSFLR